MSICIDTYIFPRWESPKSHESEVGRKAGICRVPADADARAWQLLLTVEFGCPRPIRPNYLLSVKSDFTTLTLGRMFVWLCQ